MPWTSFSLVHFCFLKPATQYQEAAAPAPLFSVSKSFCCPACAGCSSCLLSSFSLLSTCNLRQRGNFRSLVLYSAVLRPCNMMCVILILDNYFRYLTPWWLWFNDRCFSPDHPTPPARELIIYHSANILFPVRCLQDGHWLTLFWLISFHEPAQAM